MRSYSVRLDAFGGHFDGDARRLPAGECMFDHSRPFNATRWVARRGPESPAS